MAEILLINPSRRKGKKMARRKTRSAAQRRATARLVAMNRGRKSRSRVASRRRRGRRPNPISVVTSRATTRRPARRRANPLGRARRVVRRRRNPIALGVSARGIMGSVKDALIGAGGAVAIDAIYGRIAPMLPASLQRGPTVGAGDAVKALFTIVAGKALSRMTRGLSVKMAQGSLTVQAHGIVSSMLPAGMMGYYSPARVTQGSNRVGPMRNGMSAYLPAGSKSPLLNAYMRGGVTPLLSGNLVAREREGITSYK